MKKYNDKELNRLLSAADELLSDIQRYETPEEEKRRTEREETERQERQNAVEDNLTDEAVDALTDEAAASEYQQTVEQTDGELLTKEDPADDLPENSLTGEEPIEESREEPPAYDNISAENFIEERDAEDEAEIYLTAGDPAEEEMTATLEETMPVSDMPSAPDTLSVSDTPSVPFGWLVAVIGFAFMELMVHWGLYREIDASIVYPLCFAAGLGGIVALVASCFERKVNTVIFMVLYLLYALYCDFQMVYHAVSEHYFIFSNGRENIRILMQNRDMIAQAVVNLFPWLVLMFLPVIVWAVAWRHMIRIEHGGWLYRVLIGLGAVLTVAIGIVCLDIHGYDQDSPYVCFYHFQQDENLEATGKQLGVTAMTLLDCLNRNP